MPKPTVIIKKNRSNVPATDAQVHEIERLNGEGLLDLEIGQRIGLSSETVRRYRHDLGLPSNRGKHKRQEPNIPDVGPYDNTVMRAEPDWKMRCKDILGDRLHLDLKPGYHTLDKKPALTQHIIDTANRIAPLLGKPHIGKKPADLFKPRLVEGRV